MDVTVVLVDLQQPRHTLERVGQHPSFPAGRAVQRCVDRRSKLRGREGLQLRCMVNAR